MTELPNLASPSREYLTDAPSGQYDSVCGPTCVPGGATGASGGPLQDEPSVAASPPVVGKPSVTFPVGRICATDACTTVLSRYNSSPWCNAHEGAERKLRPLKLGMFLNGGRVTIVEEIDAKPDFRCDGCELIYEITRQWKTPDHRWCPWCKPAKAHRSDEPDLRLR